MKVRYVTVGLSEHDARLLDRQLAELGEKVGHWYGVHAKLSEVLAAEADVVLVGGLSDLTEALRVQRWLEDHGDRPTLLLGDSEDPVALRAAMRAGADDLVHPLRDRERLRELFTQMGRALDDATMGSGSCIAVLGSHGGVGVTAIALAVSQLLAQDPERRVLLVDLDESGGDVRGALSLPSAYDHRDVLRQAGELEPEALRARVARLDNGLFILPHPEETAFTEPLGPDDVRALLRTLRRSWTHVVLDLGSGLHEGTRAALPTCSDLLLITQQQPEPLRGAHRRLDILRELGVPRDRVQLVLNRYEPDLRPLVEEVSDALRHPVDFRIANDHPRVRAAAVEGVSVPELDPESEVAYDLHRLEARLTGSEDPGPPPRGRRRWWQRLRRS